MMPGSASMLLERVMLLVGPGTWDPCRQAGSRNEDLCCLACGTCGTPAGDGCFDLTSTGLHC